MLGVTFDKNGNTESEWTIKISNNSDKLAFFIRPQLMADGRRNFTKLLDGSYFTLAPSESATVSVSCPVCKLKGKKSHILVSGWNLDPIDMKIN